MACCLLLLLGSLLRHAHENVRHTHESAAVVNALLGLGIDTACSLFKVVVVDKCRTQLLVAVHTEFLAEISSSVNTGSLGSKDLELEVHEKIDIFIDAFLVHHSLFIVLVVRVFELRPCDRLAVYGHDYGVVGLCRHGARHGEQCHQQCLYLHFCLVIILL